MVCGLRRLLIVGIAAGTWLPCGNSLDVLALYNGCARIIQNFVRYVLAKLAIY